jgi:hypothetical protein
VDRKIIDGVRFDTETSLVIGYTDAIEQGECTSVADFQYWEATLYKSPRAKRYFLAGAGGPMTRFAAGRPYGCNKWTGGSDIIPLSPKEALVWSNKYLPQNIVEAEFRDFIQDA